MARSPAVLEIEWHQRTKIFLTIDGNETKENETRVECSASFVAVNWCGKLASILHDESPQIEFSFLPRPSSYHPKRKHALVIGGSVAGMLAARVLANHFQRVTLIEKDILPDGPEPRSGLPQARHIHVLLDAGRRALDRLLPQLVPDLVAAGAVEYDAIADFKWISPAGLCPRFPSKLRMLGATRDFIDWGIRQQLRNTAQIETRTKTRVINLATDETATRVVGVYVADAESDRVTKELLHADLVVDASGRASSTPQWLETLGFPRPQEIVIKGFLGYASQLVQPPNNWQEDWKTYYIQNAPPTRKRGGVIAVVENGNWIVTLAGGGKDYPQTDPIEFREFAKSLPDPSFAEAYCSARPITPIVATKSTANRLLRYEKLTRRPEGLLVIGDAVCAYNPVYGQGITAAAIGAVLLDECLKVHRSADSNLPIRFQRRLARANSRPWTLATGEDYRYREVAGPPASFSTRMVHRYLNRITELATRSNTAHQRMAEVLHLVRSPASLFAPWLLTQAYFSRTSAPTSKVSVTRDPQSH